MATPAQQADIAARILELLNPRFAAIDSKLDNLVTRREHEKDIAEIQADIAGIHRDMDKLRAWQDDRPRRTVDEDRVIRIETDVKELQARPQQTHINLRDDATLFFIAIGAIVTLVLAVSGHLTWH